MDLFSELRGTRYHPLVKTKLFRMAGNKIPVESLNKDATPVAVKPFRRDQLSMTISTRIALGVSAAALSLSLALAPAAFAQDKMGSDSMKKDSMSKDSMSKDSMKKDTMSKDSMKSGDGMMKKDSMSKDTMKK